MLGPFGAGVLSVLIPQVRDDLGTTTATSVYSAFRFAGLALAPVIWLPLFHADPQLPFLVAGVLSLLVCPLVPRIDPRGTLAPQ